MLPSESIERFDASTLPEVGFDYDSPLWWGQLLMCVAEGMSLALMVAIYFYARLQFAEWPPAGTHSVSGVWPIVNVAILLASCVPMRIGDKAVLHEDWHGAQLWGWVSVAMGAVASALHFYILSLFQFRWDSNLYGSVIWFSLGFLAVHLVVSTLETAAILMLAALGYRDNRVRLALNVDEVYWFLVVGATLVIYSVVFGGVLL